MRSFLLGLLVGLSLSALSAWALDSDVFDLHSSRHGTALSPPGTSPGILLEGADYFAPRPRQPEWFERRQPPC